MVDMPGRTRSPRRRHDLDAIARRAMLERGLEPEFPAAALAQADGIRTSAVDPSVADLRHLPWCSIDNDDSRDLDQLTVAEPLAAGAVKVRVAPRGPGFRGPRRRRSRARGAARHRCGTRVHRLRGREGRMTSRPKASLLTRIARWVGGILRRGLPEL